MNRTAFKSLGTLLLGVALGWGIGDPPWRSGEAGTSAGPPAKPEGGIGAGRAGSGSKPGTGKARGKPGIKPLERLAARLHDEAQQGYDRMTGIRVMAEAASLSPEEFGPLMSLLERKKPTASFSGEANARRSIVEILTLRWATLAPEAALAFAMDRQEIKADADLMFSLVSELAKTDLPGAKAAVHSLRGGGPDLSAGLFHLLLAEDVKAGLDYGRELGRDAEIEALKFIGRQDPMAAAAELTPGREDEEAVVREISRALIAKGAGVFEAWAGNLSDPVQRRVIRSVVLAGKVPVEPEAAAKETAAWLAGEPEASKQVGGLPEVIVQKWLEHQGQPATVAAWAAGLPAGPARDMAVREMGQWWLRRDPMAASVWLGALPPGDGRDRAVQGLVEIISPETPGDAFEWARTIQEHSARYSALRNSVAAWASKDPAATLEAVEAMPFDDRNYLRDELKAARKRLEEATEPK